MYIISSGTANDVVSLWSWKLNANFFLFMDLCWIFSEHKNKRTGTQNWLFSHQKCLPSFSSELFHAHLTSKKAHSVPVCVYVAQKVFQFSRRIKKNHSRQTLSTHSIEYTKNRQKMGEFVHDENMRKERRKQPSKNHHIH